MPWLTGNLEQDGRFINRSAVRHPDGSRRQACLASAVARRRKRFAGSGSGTAAMRARV